MKEQTIKIEVTIEAEDELTLREGYFNVTKVVVDGERVKSEDTPSFQGSNLFWSIYNTPVNGLHLEYGEF